MLRTTLFSLFFCLQIFVLYANSNPLTSASSSFVLGLTPTSFQDILTINPYLLVRFEKSWSADLSIALKPFFLSAAHSLHHENPDLVVGSFNASRYYQISNKYNLMEFPAIVLFSQGETHVYEGDQRDSNKLKEWAQRLINPQKSIELLTKVADVKKVIEEKVFIAYVTHGSKDQEYFYKLVIKTGLEKQVLYEVNDPKIAKSLGEKLGTLVSYYSDQPSALVLSKTPIKKVQSWLTWQSDYILSEATIARLNYLNELGDPYAVFTLPESHDDWIPKLEKWANNFEYKLHFLYTANEENTISFEQYGISIFSLPALVVYNTSQRFLVWNEKQPLREKEVLGWLKKCLNGQAKTYERSEPVLDPKSTAPFLQIVGSNYKTYLTKPSQYLLVFVHTDACRACVRITETLKGLSPLLRDQIRLAKFNVELNAHPPEHYYQEIPNLLLFSPNNSVPTELSIPFNLFNIYTSLVNLTRGKLDLDVNITFSEEDKEDDDSFDNYEFIKEEQDKEQDDEGEEEEEEEEVPTEDAQEDAQDETNHPEPNPLLLTQIIQNQNIL